MSCLLSIDTVFSKSNIWIKFSSSIRLYLRVLWRCKIWLTWLLWRNNHFLFPVHAFQATPHPLLSISEGKFTNDKNNIPKPHVASRFWDRQKKPKTSNLRAPCSLPHFLPIYGVWCARNDSHLHDIFPLGLRFRCPGEQQYAFDCGSMSHEDIADTRWHNITQATKPLLPSRCGNTLPHIKASAGWIALPGAVALEEANFILDDGIPRQVGRGSGMLPAVVGHRGEGRATRQMMEIRFDTSVADMLWQYGRNH